MKNNELPEIKKLWNYSKPEETRKKFEELIPVAEASGDKSYLLQLQTQIARTHGLQLQFDRAHEILDEVKDQITSELNVVKIRYLLERGRAFNSDNKKEKAKQNFLQAWELAKKVQEHNFAVDAAHMMGIAEQDPNMQIKWNRKAMNYAESCEDDGVKDWLGPLYNNTGWSLFDLQRYDEALELFSKCKLFHKERNNVEPELISKWSIARTYRSLNNIEKALDLQLEIEKERAGNNLPVGGYNQEELGELYLLKGNNELAKKHFKTAYELLSQDAWFVKNENERLTRIKELSI